MMTHHVREGYRQFKRSMKQKRQDTILIVDDNPANLGVLFDFLRGQGFKVLVAETGQDALDSMAYAKPDIILLDVVMPGIDGFETCRRLKANSQTKNIPVIFMTALSEVIDKVKGFTVGAVDYITKPIQVSEVLARVQAHLTIRNLQRSLQQQIITYRRLLADELDVEPNSTIAALYKEIEITAQQNGTHPASPSPTNDYLIFLFTDIEGSTRLWDTYQQAMLPALLRHNNILKQQITRHGGRILELRGDGVKAVFEGVNPLPCVLDIQRQFGQEEWGAIGELRIRIGLHGVANTHENQDFFKQGDQYYGPVLNYAARVMDAGWGGQILTSEVIKKRFPLPQEAAWQSFGEHRLRGLEVPQEIYGLLHPDLPLQEFPPLRTLTTKATLPATGPLGKLARQVWQETAIPNLRHNLPPVSPLVGRETYVKTITHHLQEPECRLLNLTGAAGIGKTHLALAATQTSQMKDGVFYVSPPVYDAPDVIVAAIMAARQLPLYNTSQPIAQLTHYLHNKEMLLILDGLEGEAATSLLTELLTAAPKLKLLVLSRTPLDMPQALVIPLAALPLPAAQKLFHTIQPDANPLYSEALCHTLAGHPLAIKLVAATPLQLSLSTGDTPLQVAIQAIWPTLPLPEQQALANLATCFYGRFTPTAALNITNVSTEILHNLVQKQLLEVDSNGWYRLPQALPFYVPSTSSIKTCQEQHVSYFVNKLTQAASDDRTDLLNVLPDIQAAWYQALQNGKASTVRQFITGIYRYCQAKGWFTIGQQRLGEAISILDRGNVWTNNPDKALLLGMALWRLGSLYLQNEQYDRAHAYLRRSLTIFPTDQAQQEQAQAWYQLATFAYIRGKYEVANSHYEKSLNLSRATEAHTQVARTLRSIGLVRQALSDKHMARAYLEESVALYRTQPDVTELADALNHLAQLLCDDNQLNEARQLFQESLILVQPRDNRLGIADALEGLGVVAQTQGTYWEAKQLFQESATIREEIGDRWGTAFALTLLGDTAVALGELEQFRICFRKATRLVFSFFIDDISVIRRHRHNR